MNVEADGIRGEFEADELLPSSPSINMTLFDHDGSLRSLFKIDQDTTFVKWKFDILYNNVKVQEMWLHPTDIDYNTSLYDKDVVIDKYGLEREFRQYFENVDLPAADTYGRSEDGIIPNFNRMWLSDFLSSL